VRFLGEKQNCEKFKGEKRSEKKDLGKVLGDIY